jgi:hypothetical protein
MAASVGPGVRAGKVFLRTRGRWPEGGEGRNGVERSRPRLRPRFDPHPEGRGRGSFLDGSIVRFGLVELGSHPNAQPLTGGSPGLLKEEPQG